MDEAKALAVLSINSPLHHAIDRAVTSDAVSFANRRAAGSSGSMNGALDYTATTIIDLVREHLGLPTIYPKST